MTSPPARRRATMADVARAAGVSVMSVSYTYGRPERVSAEVRVKVREAAERLGYRGPHPGARSLRTGRAGSLGVVLGERLTYAFDDPEATRFLSGVASVCLEHQVGMTLLPVTGDEHDVERVLEAAVDGFVIWTTVDDNPVLDAVVATGRPAAVLGGPARPGVSLVSIDDRAAAAAVGAVAFAGASRPAVLSFPLDGSRRAHVVRGPDTGAVSFSVTRHRLQGYRDAAGGLGLDWSDVQVVVASRNDGVEGEALVGDLLGSPDAPDAIAAMSDELALGALGAAGTHGVAVPGLLSVTGWDDTPAAAPADLTTVAQSLHEQGARCAHLALGNRPAGDAPAWRLLVRGTTR